MLEIKEIVAAYGSKRVLFGVNIFLRENEVVTLLGANGVGKSTTLKCIMGLLNPTGGDILLEGKSIKGLAPDEIVTKGIAYVPEGRRLFPELSVLENLRMGAFTRRRHRQAVETTLEMVLELFPQLQERLGQLAGTLSGGQQQMVAIGRGLMAGPKVLLLDEPSLGIAPLLVREIAQQILRLREEGTSILLVEQNVAMAQKLADRAYIMSGGRSVMTLSNAELQEKSRVVSTYLGMAQ
ncbi:MAG: ABC transporter ATP-binding protein [Bacillota bacterium]